jgi:hypothetical protein
MNTCEAGRMLKPAKQRLNKGRTNIDSFVQLHSTMSMPMLSLYTQ